MPHTLTLIGFAPAPLKPCWGICDCRAVVEVDYDDTQTQMSYAPAGTRKLGSRWVKCPQPKCKKVIALREGRAPDEFRNLVPPPAKAKVKPAKKKANPDMGSLQPTES